MVPAGKNIRVLQTSTDVIHSWFIPSLGAQRYAIPGRTIETWFRADKPGVFYGQCNQICGTNHSPHADRRARRDAGGVRRLADRGEDQILGCGAGDATGAGERRTAPSGRGRSSALTRRVGA